jgi:hypothetical protein
VVKTERREALIAFLIFSVNTKICKGTAYQLTDLYTFYTKILPF